MKRIIQALAILSAFAFSLTAQAQVGRTYDEGPVTAVTYLKIEYGHFDEYIDWLNSTWKPLNEAKKKAGLIIDYKVFTARPKTPDEPNVIFMITYPNMAGLRSKDRGRCDGRGDHRQCQRPEQGKGGAQRLQEESGLRADSGSHIEIVQAGKPEGTSGAAPTFNSFKRTPLHS